MAPEMISGEAYSFPCDVYRCVRGSARCGSRARAHCAGRHSFSYGIVMWEVLTCRLPWQEEYGDQRVKTMERHVRLDVIDGKRPGIPSGSSAPFLWVMRQCWCQDPDQRPSFEEVYRQLQLMHRTHDAGYAVERERGRVRPPRVATAASFSRPD